MSPRRRRIAAACLGVLAAAGVAAVSGSATAATVPKTGLAATPVPSAAAAGFHGYVYVPSTSAGKVNVIDTGTDAVVKQFSVGPDPSFARATPDGSQVFVSNFNVLGSSYVSAYRPATGAITKIPVSGFVWGMVISPDGHWVYVATGKPTYDVIDTTTDTVVQTVKIGGTPDGIEISPDDNTLYLAFSPGLVSAYDTSTNTLIHKAMYAGGVENPYLFVSKDGSKLYSLNWITNNVSVIDTKAWKVTATIDTGSNSEPIIASSPPDGKTLYITDFGTNKVTVVDVATNKILTTLQTPGKPFMVGFTPDGKKAYLDDFGPSSASLNAPFATTLLQILLPVVPISTGNGEVVPFDPATNVPTGAPIVVGGDPSLMAFTR